MSEYRTVWKFQLTFGDVCELYTPLEITPLHVGLQRHNICVWALCSPESGSSLRRFYIRGTGHNVPPNAKYIGTVNDGQFVWHVFYE